MTSDRTSTALLVDDAQHLALEHLALDAEDVLAGAPTTGHAPLHSDAGVEVGIWEITSGVVTDIEVDEVFVVLSGRGRLEFEDGSGILMAAGTVVLLKAGDRTKWFIYETLRKVYVALPVKWIGSRCDPVTIDA